MWIKEWKEDRILHAVDFHFVKRGPLACICHDDVSATIYIHHILNSQDTPREVLDLVFKHELIHLEIPPAEIKGREVQHPPEFREREEAICTERELAWGWIYINLWQCLKVRPRLQRIDVAPCWKNYWWRSKCDFQYVRDREARAERRAEEMRSSM